MSTEPLGTVADRTEGNGGGTTGTAFLNTWALFIAYGCCGTNTDSLYSIAIYWISFQECWW